MKTSIRLMIAVFGLALAATTVQAQFDYFVTNGTVTIRGYRGLGGNVVVPGEISGLPVTSIGDMAFCGWTSLTSVVIG
jgi:hypothetical protein